MDIRKPKNEPYAETTFVKFIGGSVISSGAGSWVGFVLDLVGGGKKAVSPRHKIRSGCRVLIYR